MICVNSVRVTPGSVTLQAGKWYYGARAEVCPLNASCRSVRWWSENPNVASVNASSGYIYARAAGTVTIWATANDGSGCRDCMTDLVKSAIPVESVELVPGSLSMETGSSYLLSAVVCPVNATKKSVTWCSSNTGVATVSSSGRVTAVSKGSAIITATANDGSGKCGCCQVAVTDKILVSSVIVSPANYTMVVGDFVFLRETVCPTNASDKCVIWSSSDETILSVNSVTGFVHALKVGTAKIYATARDGSNVSGSCAITVQEPIKVDSVSILYNQITMIIGQKRKLSVTVCPVDATKKSVKWNSSNTSVATVDSYTGTITAKSQGSAIITATSIDNPSAKDTCIVNVNGMLIYQTRDREREGFKNSMDDNDITPIIPEDLTYGQKNTTTLCTNGTYISTQDLFSGGFSNQYSVDYRVGVIKNFFNSQINYEGTFKAILSEMVDHFIDGTGTDYTNANLTAAVTGA